MARKSCLKGQCVREAQMSAAHDRPAQPSPPPTRTRHLRPGVQGDRLRRLHGNESDEFAVHLARTESLSLDT